MTKDYFVLTDDIEEDRVLYEPGHYDIEGARATMRQDQKAHPRRSYFIVRVEEQYIPVDATPPKFSEGDLVYIKEVHKTKIVVRAYDYSGEWKYLLRDENDTLNYGWREDELELL